MNVCCAVVVVECVGFFLLPAHFCYYFEVHDIFLAPSSVTLPALDGDAKRFKVLCELKRSFIVCAVSFALFWWLCWSVCVCVHSFFIPFYKLQCT